MQSLKGNSSEMPKKYRKIILLVVAVALLIAIGISSLGFIDNDLRIESNQLVISGYRGSSIPLADIDSIYLTMKRPEAIRISGYQMGYRKIGLFRNKKGEQFSMHIQSRALPWIVIRKKDGFRTYFSHTRKSNEKVYEMVVSTLPMFTDSSR